MPQARAHDPNNRYVNRLRHIINKQIGTFVDPSGVRGSPGIVVGLVTPFGDVIEGMGTRKKNEHLRPNENTLFAIGSITKVFTGIMLAKAVTDGHMKLSSKVNNWLDDRMQLPGDITLEQLITHHSGLPNFPDNIRTSERYVRKPTVGVDINQLMPAKNYNKEQLISWLKSNRQASQKVFASGYLYSNLGIGMLSMALQEQYGFDDFNTMNNALITRVLKMDDTSTNTPDFLEKHNTNQAQGYVFQQNRLQPVPYSDMGILAGSGELISNVSDMTHLLRALTGLSSVPLSAAIKESKRQLAMAEKGASISYAQDIRQASDGGAIYYKTGITAGYTAIMFWRDEPKIGLVILANRGKLRPLLPAGYRLMEIVTRLLKQRHR